MRLASGIHATAGFLHQGGARSDAPVRLERKGGDVPAVIIGDQHESCGLVEADVTRFITAGRLLIEPGETRRFRINGVGADAAMRSAVDRVEMTAIGMN